MTCPRCQIEFNSRHWGECPHCGDISENGGQLEGVIKTSTILISTDDGGVFGSIEDVPESLREALVTATTGADSATIFIADRLGRSRIAASLPNFPVDVPLRPGICPSIRQQARPRLRATVPALIWGGFLVAGVSGALVWFVISHLK